MMRDLRRILSPYATALAMCLLCAARVDAGPLSGASFEASDYGVFVQSVSTGSPSYKVGLRKGDRVLSVNGESWFSLISDFDRNIEMALADGKSLVFEISRGSDEKKNVWLKTPSLSAEDRRFLENYLAVRSLWDGALDIWDSIKMDYKKAFLEEIPWDRAKKDALDKSSELISIKNTMVRSIPQYSNGEKWEILNEAREAIESVIFLMDQEAYRLFKGYPASSGSRGRWKNPRTFKSGISEVERLMVCSLHASKGVVLFE